MIVLCKNHKVIVLCVKSQGNCAVCEYHKVIVLCVSTGGAVTKRCEYYLLIVLCVLIAR